MDNTLRPPKTVNGRNKHLVGAVSTRTVITCAHANCGAIKKRHMDRCTACGRYPAPQSISVAREEDPSGY